MVSDFFQKVYSHPTLRPADYKIIRDAHTEMDLHQGTLVLEIGKIAQQFYVIQNGLFRSFLYDYKGNEITTGFYGNNEILIESLSLFQRTPSKENFEAITDAVVWKIEYDVFQQLLYEIEGLREWGRTYATNQLFVLKQHFINLRTKSATDRYLDLLNNKPQIVRQSQLKYIASYLGVTDTSLSRIRREIAAG